jgi:uncharacterized protein (TIGR02246 family)
MKKILVAAVLAVVLAAIPSSVRAADTGAKAAFERTQHDFVSAWNAHDSKKLAMVFAEDGDLINPFGRVEKGRAAIEGLFAEEQGGVMKPTTYKIEASSMREIGADLAVADWAGIVAGMMTPDGKPAPDFQHSVTLVYQKRSGHWLLESARAYIFVPKPAK